MVEIGSIELLKPNSKKVPVSMPEQWTIDMEVMNKRNKTVEIEKIEEFSRNIFLQKLELFANVYYQMR